MAKVTITKRKTFLSLVEAANQRGTVPVYSYQSRKWYRERAMRLRHLREGDTQRILKIGRLNKRMKRPQFGRQMLGKLWMFEYDPISAEDTLGRGGYYDSFPCVFPIQPMERGFMGINMHFLPYDWRAVLMDQLYDLVNDVDNLEENTRLNIPAWGGYNFLRKSSKYRYFKPCIRKYLFSQTLSRYMLIPSTEWEIALFMPLERFHGQSRRKIWMDTKKRYRRGL